MPRLRRAWKEDLVTWMHWMLFCFLSLLAVGMATDKKTRTRTRLTGFILLVGMILFLILGQPK